LVAAARERGVEITADQYPWLASGTSLSSSLIPRWVQADSEEAMFERLANADLEDRIREEMEANLRRRGGHDSLLVTGESEWRGMTLKEIAEDLLQHEIGRPGRVRDTAVGDDRFGWIGGASAKICNLSQGLSGYGGYEIPVLPALFRLSQQRDGCRRLFADAFYLCDRGYLRPGMIADIAIIDLDEFKPIADFKNPMELSTGVSDLLVNGKPAIVDGQYTGALHGTVVNRQQLECPE
jgi:hypothetical protein